MEDYNTHDAVREDEVRQQEGASAGPDYAAGGGPAQDGGYAPNNACIPNNAYVPNSGYTPNNGYAPNAGYAPNGYYRHDGQGGTREKGGRAAGYVLTGVLCLLLGMAVGGCTAAVVLSGVDAKVSAAAEQIGEGEFEERIDDFIGDGWEREWRDEWRDEWRPGGGQDEYVEPEPQEYVQRELPDFDGTAPVITDPSNPVIEIVEHVYDGVVGVNVYYDEYGEEYLGGYGSGFVVSSEGYIITNYHVVQGSGRITVTFPDGEEVEAELIGGDVNVDTAVLKIEKAGLTPLALGDSGGLRVGEFSLAIGNPSGSELAGSVTFGIISATSRSINVDGRVLEVIQTDAAINMGNSGGPLLDMEGRVIGITAAKNVYAGFDEYGSPISAEGLSFAIPINQAMEVVEQIITQGHVSRPGLGINVIGLTPEDAEYFELPEGILIYSVTKNGPAHKAGIKVDDIVLEYDGITADSQDGFVEYVQEMDVGDTVTLKIWRDGEELEIEAVLGDMNQMGAELVGDRVSDLFE